MDREQLLREVNYKAVKSSGPGGQHVNKTASKVELQFDVEESAGISEEEKSRIIEKLESRLTKGNILILQSDESRSQHKNKEYVSQRFLNIVEEALKKPKIRKKTRPSKASKMKRLKKKKMNAEKKAGRKDPLK
ncbi:alternative ribosome rescue aminoacyl-tRNA hydrolase ArfB [Salegentibacter sp. F188]|uniref:Alternative ribosome rescue aminoacyl-tRNA hydrolase ArfB n=1 Tax=Autumnicola patrickiae TaxID=3075591 RepID=A0ABU3E1Q4_9FLAO|nr:alternative ribosome rescue aminoacyl-tRNA hydrolase ArfB [Salegentibacter sp. F188]MDT0689929.1 alternative ribosome rescue aminoacyl-tRNA hydrolase ArfB [Salegentibacter sp. F188]